MLRLIKVPEHPIHVKRIADKLNSIIKEKHWIRLSEAPNITVLIS
jgi:hypothetical protein